MTKFGGLTAQEAQQRLQEFGPNEIADVFKVSRFSIFIRQIKKNFVVYLLLGAAIISLAVGKGITGYTIFGIVILIVMVGFFQEYKAEKAIKALKQMIMPVTLAIRDGREVEIESKDLVRGDVVILRTGEKVPADCLVLEAKDLRLDEAILTGESREVLKKPASGKDHVNENLIFMGTHVTAGKCVAEVLHTGMNTEFGQIAGLISGAEKELPLQNKVNRIAKVMVTIGLSVSFLTGLIMILRSLPLTTESGIEILVVVIALAVSSFPEGFPVVLMSALAGGAYSMAQENAIVNRMSIIETLGETTVICADKTGTITTGEMTVRNILAGEKEFDVSGVGYQGVGEFEHHGRKVSADSDATLNDLLKAVTICSDSHIERTGEDHEFRLIGTPTEGALLVAAAKAGIYKNDLDFEIFEEVPFSSERKMMSVAVAEKGERFVYTKGAPEAVLTKCTFIKKNGKVVKLNEAEKEQITAVQTAWSQKRYRVMAAASKPYKEKENLEDGLVFLGLFGLEDPPREEVKESLKACARAGIGVKMITGDNKDTALEIAKEIGLPGGQVMTGVELEETTDQELLALVNHVSVFARVKPEHKLRIVRALKENGEIVTMTGDGVNDAPALKEAHIGVAMGKNGTDVSREAADLVLKDDNFSTIVSAVRAGRGIFSNIQKFITLQLSLNYAELFIIFFGILLGLPLPLLALHILFMNMVTDNMSALSLAFNPISEDIMEQKPRRKAGIFTREMLGLLVLAGTVIGGVALGVFYATLQLTGDVTLARTNTLVALVFLEIANAFNFRSFRQFVHRTSLWRNKYLVGAAVLSTTLTVLVVSTPINRIFELTPLPLANWLILACLPLIVILTVDIWKMYKGKNKKRMTNTSIPVEV